MRRIVPTVALVVGGLFLAAGLQAVAREKRIALRFTPKENVTANVPAVDQAAPVEAIEVAPLVDARALRDLSVIGENREHSTPRPVKAAEQRTVG